MPSKDYAAKIKATAFILLPLTALIIYRLTPVGQYLDPQAIRDLATSNGIAAPIIFILIYGFGITMFLPASFFTAIGALLFGFSWGLFYNFAGAMLGASMSFWVGRYLGRDFAASLIGNRLQAYDNKLSTRGFETTLYLRLLFFPFTPLNFGMGLTSVTFSHYFWGTFCGKIASGVILTFFFATLAEVWSSGQWQGLLGWKTWFSLCLFTGSFFIPKIAQRLFPSP
jgi:uncharacterized membrane protein YdjX (TVP38/TMEM64 family)